MPIFKWLRGKPKKPQKKMKGKLVDLAHTVLVDDPFYREQFFAPKVRAKVKQFLSIPFPKEDADEMVDEITEKITEVAQADPRLDRLLKNSD